MSEIQKCPNLVRGGGGPNFLKMSEIQQAQNLCISAIDLKRLEQI